MLDYLYYHFFHGFHAMYLALVVLVPMLVAEITMPAERLHWPTVAFNLLYGPIFIAVAGMALHPISSYFDPLVTLGMVGGDPASWSWWQLTLFALSYIAAFDFLYYWLHRAQHRFAFLWRYHRFHHADANLSASSAFRHHWLEDTFRYFVIAAPLLVMYGSISRVLPAVGLVMGVYGLFIHWNSRLTLGPLRGVLVGPLYHRLHHSMAAEHHDKNFAIFFPVLDRLFGTQVLPEKTQVPRTGIPGTVAPNHWKQLLPLPPLKS
jgi:sterol desaturase/sphingolipid hydroxylase (fatty acid hydroxylase superfamily)